MNFSGLCSISFRNLTPEEVIQIAADAGLDGIEWGSDVHIRPGDVQTAARISAQMQQLGLKNLSYGTYFGVDGLDADDLLPYLETAKALGTQVLRIWPPDHRPGQMTEEQYQIRVRFMQQIADTAAEHGMTLCFERHPGTLTQEPEDILAYIKDIDRPNVKMYWQPNQYLDVADNLRSIEALKDITVNIHVFHWRGMERFPLSEGIEEWKRYVQAFGGREVPDRAYLLEFMHDDDPASLKATAAALHEILKE